MPYSAQNSESPSPWIMLSKLDQVKIHIKGSSEVVNLNKQISLKNVETEGYSTALDLEVGGGAWTEVVFTG